MPWAQSQFYGTQAAGRSKAGLQPCRVSGKVLPIEALYSAFYRRMGGRGCVDSAPHLLAPDRLAEEGALVLARRSRLAGTRLGQCVTLGTDVRNGLGRCIVRPHGPLISALRRPAAFPSTSEFFALKPTNHSNLHFSYQPRIVHWPVARYSLICP